MAWVRRSRPCLAEPPAESPSTMKISHSAGSFSWQSASLPGSPAISSAPLRRVISRALRAASRARAASMILPTMALASCRMLQQELGELCATACLDHALHFRRDQLFLGLRGELRVGQLHRQDGRETLRASRRPWSGPSPSSPPSPFRCSRSACASARRGSRRDACRRPSAECCSCSRTSLSGIGIVPLHRHFDADCSFLGTKPEHRGMNCRCASGSGASRTPAGRPRARTRPTSSSRSSIELDAHAGVQERQLAQALGQDVVVERDVGEDRSGWP